MKGLNKLLAVFTILASVLALTFFSSCSDSDSEPLLVDPSDSDALSGVLDITGNKVSGDLPEPDGNSGAPTIDNNQGSALIVSGSTLFLPFTYPVANSAYAGCYVQVEGASDYWDIPDNSISSNNDRLLVIPVGVPSQVLTGSFSLLYCIYDDRGFISNVLQTDIEIDSVKTCPDFITGTNGLTIAEYDLGETPGEVTLSHDMLTIKDRMDVFYNDAWIGGTGSSLLSTDFPPVSFCGDGTEGYVSGDGSVSFQYDPDVAKTVKIYMSGCIEGSTVWRLTVGCPQ